MIGKVLFVMEKWCAGNPEFGPTNCEVMLIETLEDTGFVGTIQKFYYDELSQQIGMSPMGELLLEVCGKEQPDLIIFTPMGLLGLDPPRFIMDIVTNRLGMQVLMIRFDSIGEEGHRFTNSWFPFVSSIAFFDSTLGHLGYGQKAIQGFSSFNPKYFYDKKFKRDTDVCFVGGIPNFPRRAEYIEFLREHGVKVVTAGGQRFNRLSWEEYSDIISRSKISLNFCLNGSGYSQFKGRVFETTACNTFLLEDEGIETKEFFDEGKDFIMVHSKEEMLEKVRYYLEHDDQREAIAESGYKKVTELYNSKNVWAYMLNKMGFNVTGDQDWGQLYRKLESLR